MRTEQIGDATLYLGDCLEIVPMLSGFGAVITDPPYGIKAAKRQAHSRIRDRASWPAADWDDAPPPSEWMAQLAGMSMPVVIWGGNYFALPPSRGWLVWDKQNPKGFSLADCELAWTNRLGAVRKWTGRPPRQGDGNKFHPTQKPVALMSWCITRAGVPEGGAILDPYMGSGTTGIAADIEQRPFIGIERDERYFDIACRRIDAAQKQSRLALEPAA